MFKNKISFIIPHYNTPQKLVRLLRSINDCVDSSNAEIIIVDDKSDVDIKVLHDYIKDFTNIHLINNQTKIKGAGVCRNIGIESASGDWIIFADSDDIMLPNFYCTVKKYMKDGMDIVYFRPTSINELDGNLSNRHKYFAELISNYFENPNYNNELFLKYKIVVPWSKMYSTKFIKKNNLYFDETKVSNDVMFSTRSGTKIKKFDICMKEIYCVTKDVETLSTSMNRENYFTRLEVFINSANYLRDELSVNDLKILEINGYQMFQNMFIYKLALIDKYKAIKKLKKAKLNILPIKKMQFKIIKKNLKNFFYDIKYR